MKVITNVIETNDYSLFKSLAGNRNLNSAHLTRLTNSFKRNYLVSPIIVNEKMQIIDGQHRFEVAKMLNLPIRYITLNDYGIEEVKILNANNLTWTQKDYLLAFKDLGVEAYIKFYDFMNLYPDFGIQCAKVILLGMEDSHKKGLSGKCVNMKDFENGNIVIRDYERSCEWAEKILQIKPYYNGFNRRNFVWAMVSFFKIPYYDHSRMVERIKSNPNQIEPCVNVEKTKLMLEDIYNYRSSVKVSLRFYK